MAPIPPPPKDSDTVRAIYALHETRNAAESKRGYLGASQIGNSCGRALWYSFRHCGCKQFDGRMLRLFETGDLEEIRFVKELRGIGCTVHDVDPQTGQQFEVRAIGGHFSGHMDGAAVGILEALKAWHVLEFKTHNAKSFAALVSKGVTESKPAHYAQMQVYMHLTGMKRALYLARNKNTDELYSERVRYNRQHAEALMARAESITKAASPPQRISDKLDYYECNWCDFQALCHGNTDKGIPAVPCTISCRNCVHATPEMDTERGRWSCGHRKLTITQANQDAACVGHLFIPDLIGFAIPVDAGGHDGAQYIEYQNKDGTTWRNGRGKHNYSSEELTKLASPSVGRGLVGETKRVFDCTVEGVEVE